MLAFAFHQLIYDWNWAAAWRYRAKFIQGWTVTVCISLAALAVSTLIGVLFALARRSRLLVLRYVVRIYVELIRGTPLLVQILIFFYVVAEAFGVQNRYVVGVLTLSAFSGAYISEIVRAGIESVGKSQLDSARAVGFTRAQTYRLRHFSAGLPPDPAATCGPVCLADQRLLVALDHRDQRADAECAGSEFFHLQHVGKLPAAGARLSGSHAADLALDALPGGP